MKVLITGITGFAGSHLAEHLLCQGGFEVHGTLRWRSIRDGIRHIQENVTLHECELRDPFAVMRLIDAVEPDWIVHLASQSKVAVSWNAPADTLVNNITAQLNLFEALRQRGRSATRILVAGSSEEYGLVHDHELPVRETNPLRPLSPYAVSKVAQDHLGYQYFMSHGLQVVRTRTFNHTGPRHSDDFVTANFARQIIEIEMGRRPAQIQVGNLDARRDFTDIRDVVRAYVLALRHCEAGEVYNIGSGKALSIGQVLERMLAMADRPIEIKPDPARMRPSDVPVMVCDSAKFRARTGWTPQISFDQTLGDLLADFRARLAPHAIN